MKQIIAFLFSILFFFHMLYAQDGTDVHEFEGVYLVETMVIDGDTVPVVTLRTADVSSARKSRSKRYQRKWSKLKRNVVKTYPYAEVAGELIQEYNRNLLALETEAEREFYLNKCEEDLKAEFEGDLRKMTISQGHVLIKLIDRETGNTSFELIKELKGGFSAFVWQGVAKIFGSNLKENYDPYENETDGMIEEIVMMIESGEIPVAKREIKTAEANEILAKKDKRLQRKIEREKKKINRKKGNS